MQKVYAKGFIIGIDEVGRGALAGPVVVAAVAITTNSKTQKLKNSKLRDSKKLSPRQREMWFDFIKEHRHKGRGINAPCGGSGCSLTEMSGLRPLSIICGRSSPRQAAGNSAAASVKKSALSHGIASVSPKIIDKINISNAANLAATKALKKLLTNNKQLITNNYKVFLDGGLYLKGLKAKSYKLKAETIIKGDEKIPAISLASIVAKVSRDRLMKKLHKKYPRYDFIHNVGYGTKKHIKAIKKYGLSPIHRKSFKIKI